MVSRISIVFQDVDDRSPSLSLKDERDKANLAKHLPLWDQRPQVAVNFLQNLLRRKQKRAEDVSGGWNYFLPNFADLRSGEFALSR
jgi:hypothetical protein